MPAPDTYEKWSTQTIAPSVEDTDYSLLITPDGSGGWLNRRYDINSAIRSIHDERMVGPFATVAELAAYSMTNAPEGLIAMVVENNAIYKYHNTGDLSTASADGNVVVAATGGGNWIKEQLSRPLSLVQGTDFAIDYTVTAPMATFYQVDVDNQGSGKFYLQNAQELFGARSVIIQNTGVNGVLDMHGSNDGGAPPLIRQLQPGDAYQFTCVNFDDPAGVWEWTLLRNINVTNLAELDDVNGTLIQTASATFKKATVEFIDVSGSGYGYTPTLNDWGNRLQFNGAGNLVTITLDQVSGTLPDGYWIDVENAGNSRLNFALGAGDTAILGPTFLPGETGATARVTLTSTGTWEVALSNLGEESNKTISSTTYDLSIDDYRRRCIWNSTNELTLSIRDDTGTPGNDLPVGFETEFFQVDSGLINISPGSAVILINESNVFHTRAAGESLKIVKVDANTYLVQTGQATSSSSSTFNLTGSYTLQPSDNGKILYKTIASNITITLGMVSSYPEGFRCTIINYPATSSVTTLTPDGTEKISGYQKYPLWGGQSATLAVIGGEWQILTRNNYSPIMDLGSSTINLDNTVGVLYVNQIVKTTPNTSVVINISHQDVFQPGDTLTIIQEGDGFVQIQGQNGITLRSPTQPGDAPFYTIGPYSEVQIRCISSTVFNITGDYAVEEIL